MTTQSLETTAPVEAAAQTAAGPRRRRNPQVAAALSIVPGLGHVYTFQWRRAAFFLLATLLTMGPAILLITASGMVLRTTVGSISRIGRQTQGVIVMRIQPDDQVITLAPVGLEEEDRPA